MWPNQVDQISNLAILLLSHVLFEHFCIDLVCSIEKNKVLDDI